MCNYHVVPIQQSADGYKLEVLNPPFDQRSTPRSPYLVLRRTPMPFNALECCLVITQSHEMCFYAFYDSFTVSTTRLYAYCLVHVMNGRAWLCWMHLYHFQQQLYQYNPWTKARCEILRAEWRRRKEDYMAPHSPEPSLLHLRWDGQMWYWCKTIHVYVSPLHTEFICTLSIGCSDLCSRMVGWEDNI